MNNIINNLICINYNCLLISIYIMEKSIANKDNKKGKTKTKISIKEKSEKRRGN